MKFTIPNLLNNFNANWNKVCQFLLHENVLTEEQLLASSKDLSCISTIIYTASKLAYEKKNWSVVSAINVVAVATYLPIDPSLPKTSYKWQKHRIFSRDPFKRYPILSASLLATVK